MIGNSFQGAPGIFSDNCHVHAASGPLVIADINEGTGVGRKRKEKFVSLSNPNKGTKKPLNISSEGNFRQNWRGTSHSTTKMYPGVIK